MTRWAWVRGFEGKYEVSDDGRVRSHGYRSEPFEMKPQVSSRGYLRVMFRIDGHVAPRSIHRLVAEAFVPNPDSLPLVRHWNDVQTDNRADNLRWGTARDNSRDILRNGNHASQRQTHCASGQHERVPENLVERRKPDGRTTMTCLPCERQRTRRNRQP
ncbi:MAG TPA: NUMOD4 domain-containing protein [Actinomycetes bacterium]|nr:NUMOD4 domain-containing protein [Actinomycetes bacterium]